MTRPISLNANRSPMVSSRRRIWGYQRGYDDRPVETPEFSPDEPGFVELGGISDGSAADRQRTHDWAEEFFDSFARFHVLTNMLHRVISNDHAEATDDSSPLSPVLDILTLHVLDLDLHAVLGEGDVALLHAPLPVRGEIVTVQVDLAGVSHATSGCEGSAGARGRRTW